MKTAAIICEYNPFHFGHNYQILELRRQLGEETTVVAIMSGSFTQRGEPAIFDKFLRAKAAVREPDLSGVMGISGVDLVVELPAPWSMSSAEFFARGGVSIAKKLGVDHLVFGGESPLSELQKKAENLKSEEFRQAFLRAREENSSDSTNFLLEKTYRQLYNSPLCTGSNDILALEYLRALDKSNIEPLCIKRLGEKYNPDGEYLSESEKFSSASTIRKALYCQECTNTLLPERVRKAIETAPIHRLSNLDSIVTAYLRFNSRQMEGIEISGGIEHKLRRAAEQNFGVEAIINASLERRFSASRLKRAIFGAICGFKTGDVESEPEFTQVLAANKRGCEFLAKVRRDSKLCILTKPANYQRLPQNAKKQFENSFRAENLWALSSDDASDRRADALMRRVPFIIK